jgi:hypothetical protein
MAFVNNGFLQVVAENETEKTVELYTPPVGTVTASGSFTSYTIIRIHPDHNAEFCPCYLTRRAIFRTSTSRFTRQIRRIAKSRT